MADFRFDQRNGAAPTRPRSAAAHSFDAPKPGERARIRAILASPPQRIAASERAAEHEAQRISNALVDSGVGPRNVSPDNTGRRHAATVGPGRAELAHTGAPLTPATRDFFEPRFGYDFSRVRVHTDSTAAATARDINAHAYTHGNNIVFAAGQYAPHTRAGRRLLGHELTHVVQQHGGGGLPKISAVAPHVQGSFFGDVWGGITSAAGAVWEGAKAVGGAIWSGVTTAAEWTWGAIKSVGQWGWDVLKSAGAWVWDLITEAPIRVWRVLKHVGSGIVGTVQWLWEGLRGGLGHLWDAAVGLFQWLGEGVEGLFGWIWTGLRGGARWAWRLLNGDFSGFWDGIGALFSWLGQGVVGLAKWGWEGLAAAAKWAWEGAKGLGLWLWRGFLAGAAWAGRLVAKLFDLVGFGEILDLLWQIIKFNTRTLTDVEIKEAKRVFGDSLSYWQVRIDEASLIALIGAWAKKSKGMGVTLFHTINFNKKISAKPGNNDMAWLIHELTHVAQMEHVGMQYIGEAVHAQATAGYKYTLDPKKHLRDYNREQQGDIARDYYVALTSGAATAGFAPFITELKKGRL